LRLEHGVELQVQGPDIVEALGPHPLGGHGGLAEPSPLAFPLRHPEAFLAPQALDRDAVQGPALGGESANPRHAETTDITIAAAYGRV
jgi:hypothetical protein